MRCQAAIKRISRYLDGELASTDRAALEAHLESCPGCRAEHAAQQELWSLLARVEPIASPTLFAAVEARLAQPRGWEALIAGLRLPALGYAAAAALAMGLFAWAGVWAGQERAAASATHDPAFVELLSDVPPGLEVVVLLDQLGGRT